ncbi:Aldehyde/histidinol dehydrogenase, partial [Suillus discolor]
GHPFSPDTCQGKHVYKTQFKHSMGYITSGKNDDATVRFCGNRISQGKYFIEPTIFAECQPDMKIVREEIFGSVVCVVKFETKDAIHVAHALESSTDGFVSSLFHLAHLWCNDAWQINCANQTEILMPFGGFKQFRIRRELSEHALKSKLVSFK